MQNTNSFSSRYESKSTNELEAIIAAQQDYQEEAVEAAKWELEKRAKAGTDEYKTHSVFFEKTGEDLYTDFLDSVDKQSSFAWTPNYTEIFNADLSTVSIRAISEQVIEKLGWLLVYVDDTQIEAKASNRFDELSEKITVIFDAPKSIQVKSISLKGGVWDNGRNSKKVKLFIHVFNEISSEYSEQGLAELEESISRKDNWDDYEVPDSLPQPKVTKEPQLIFSIIAGVLGSVLLGGLFAITTRHFYIIMLFETGLGVALAFILYQGIKLGNYTDFPVIRVIQIISTFAIVILAQYFQYLMITFQNSGVEFTFFQFIQLRMEAGFIFRDLNTGWIGWIVVIILQLLIIYFVSSLRLSFHTINFMYSRVPGEVIDFAFYHFVKGKSEIEVRNELAIKGWGDRQSQQQVFDAIGAVKEQQDYNRGEH